MIKDMLILEVNELEPRPHVIGDEELDAVFGGKRRPRRRRNRARYRSLMKRASRAMRKARSWARRSRVYRKMAMRYR